MALTAATAVSSAFAQTMPDGECATPGNDGNPTALSGIVNTYYPGTASAAAGVRCVSVGTATGSSTPIAAGDLLLIMQMQHATIDTNDDSGYGDNVNGAPGGVTNNQTAGYYEFVEARGAVGAAGGAGCTAGQVAIQGRGTGAGLLNSYSVAARSGSTGRRTFQVVRVPQYNKVTLGGALNARYWDGSTGGIVAIDVVGQISFAGQNINATGRGFRGGGGRGLGGDGDASDTDYRQPVTDNAHGAKGEGIAGTTRYLYNQETGALIDFATDEGYNNGGAARGAPGNAGGGGTDGNPATNDQNSGGGGGANGGSGGIGGNAWASQEVTGGYGGGAFAAGTPALNRVILGGGGGAGARNNSSGQTSSGGAGGGIIIVQTGEFAGNGSITANGAQGPIPDNDGGGGGGAGGTVILRDNENLALSNATGITVSVAGAAGSDAWPGQAPGGTPGERHGPGGGGGGGRILLGPSLATGTATFSGGVAGITTTANDNYGAGPGTAGSSASFTGTPPGMRPGFECAPLPVSLAHVDLRQQSGTVVARWATAAERNSVGFQWFSDADARQPLQDALIASVRGNAAEPTAYETRLRSSGNGAYWLAEYDHRGNREMHGPYHVGQEVGRSPVDQLIDWTSVTAEARVGRSASTSARGAQLWVTERGFQRVRYEDLVAAGIDLTAQLLTDIAVFRGDESVARRIVSLDDRFGPGDYIDFFAEPRVSIYGAEAVYRVELAAHSAREIPVDERAPGVSRPAWVWANSGYAPQRAYNFASPTSDPWYADRLLAFPGAPASKALSLPLTAVAQVARPAALSVDLIGASNWASSAPDHQARLRVNGQSVQTVVSDGLVLFDLQHMQTVSAQTTSLEVEVEITGETGYAFDVVNLDQATLRYPRLASAGSSRWLGENVQFDGVSNDAGTNPPQSAPLSLLADGFEDSAAVATLASLRVRDLMAAEVFAYARTGTQWRYLSDVRTEPAGAGWNAFVPTVQAGDDVFVASAAGFPAPRVTALPQAVDISHGSAQYLVISHPQFSQDLQALLQRRQSQGLTTAVVDVTQIYTQFGMGEPDPEAIRDYIAFARAQRGTRYVLLVGGDTYDYHDYLGVGSISFVPTLYQATSEVVRHAPLDAALADGDFDGVPDLAIGRLPVRTAAELSIAIDKILLAETPRATHAALLVSGASDPGTSFSGMNDDFSARLPREWISSRADVDGMGVAAARSALLSGWAQSPALISYVGHSAPGQWTYDPLLTAGDVAQLAGTTAIPAVLQWGCWNTYFVSPTANSLAQTLLLQGSHGAAAVFGAVALTDISGHQHLAPPTFSRFAAGTRIGDAILLARQELAGQGLSFVEPMLGSNLLGDPAMVLP